MLNSNFGQHRPQWQVIDHSHSSDNGGQPCNKKIAHNKHSFSRRWKLIIMLTHAHCFFSTYRDVPNLHTLILDKFCLFSEESNDSEDIPLETEAQPGLWLKRAYVQRGVPHGFSVFYVALRVVQVKNNYNTRMWSGNCFGYQQKTTCVRCLQLCIFRTSFQFTFNVCQNFGRRHHSQ